MCVYSARIASSVMQQQLVAPSVHFFVDLNVSPPNCTNLVMTIW